jgi:hypothetical protein
MLDSGMIMRFPLCASRGADEAEIRNRTAAAIVSREMERFICFLMGELI